MVQVGFDRVALVVSLVGQGPDGALRVQAARLGEPGLAETVRGVGLEISRASHDYDEARGVRGGSGTHYLTTGSRPPKPVPSAGCAVGGGTGPGDTPRASVADGYRCRRRRSEVMVGRRPWR